MKTLLRRLATRNKHTALTTPKPVVVTITGGMGSQIFSISAYFYIRQLRQDVFVDCSYFEKPAMKAAPGEGLSQWEWELNHYGISSDALPKSHLGKNTDVHRVDDGVEKMKLGLLGLNDQNIRLKFSAPEKDSNEINKDYYQQKPYVCAHIRQGDYLNVASHLVKETTYLPVLKKISKLDHIWL